MSASLRRTTPRAIVLIGPAGAGKSTVGRALARALGWSFYDADAFHSEENVARMQRGTPLTDAERAPWLARLRTLLDRALARGERLVLACSALRRAHRRALVPDAAAPGVVRFAYLAVPERVLHERLATRVGHFAPASLLASQLATLEPPGPDDALVLDGRRPVAELVREIARRLGA